ncbi:HNH endonuclease [Mobilitalea sibirica]|uniref:HNH endonuclease n=1 Tax=Mobilitalea sibirica TaxID=1462919 RepID=A0A8J7HAV9_9FIRM|nr:HNH endonuclease [Mobilitalea sibirica]MBH1941645.1 HNH endonuclease [Mobilitalea sibirica]
MSTGVLHTFYNSDEWLIFREQYILEHIKINKGVICSKCGKHIINRGDIQLHHTPIELTEDNYKDVNISMNKDNIELICRSCHNKEHGRFCGGGHKRREKAVYIIYGPPMSGKTTYVYENMEPGDLIVDMDRLYHAVSLRPMYDKPDNLKYNVFSIRNHIIDNIKTRYGGFRTAWIIGGYPEKFTREKLAEDIGAELIYVETSKELCIERLECCNDYRAEHKDEWVQYIEKWFEDYSN